MEIKIIIQDTREQAGKHKNIDTYFEQCGIRIIRDKLGIGDYSLPLDRRVCVDVKQDVVEIAGNLCSGDHERFRNECIRAKEVGARLYILIQENECNGIEITQPEDLRFWQSPKYKYGQHKGEPLTTVKGETLGKIMRTMERKYGVRFIFCDEKDAGKIILKLLGGNQR